MAPPAEETLLPVRQVASLFRVEPPTVREWIRKGLIRGIRTPGRQWRVPASQVPFMSDYAPGGSGLDGTREITHG